MVTISVTKSVLSSLWTSNVRIQHTQNDGRSLCGGNKHYLFVQNIANSLDTFGIMVQPSNLNHHTLFLGIHFFWIKILLNHFGLGGSDWSYLRLGALMILTLFLRNDDDISIVIHNYIFRFIFHWTVNILFLNIEIKIFQQYLSL